MKVGTSADEVHNVTIWGNHSSTQFPDVAHAYVTNGGQKTPVYQAVNDDAWLKGDFIKVSMLSPAYTLLLLFCYFTSIKFSYSYMRNLYMHPTYSLYSLRNFYSYTILLSIPTALLFSQTIQKRGAAIIAARKLSSAMSAAKAICDHLRDWWFGTPEVSVHYGGILQCVTV